MLIYRSSLLILKNTSSSLTKQSTTMVMAHEVGHQRTGNLVTLSWWSYTWLNEGFATFFEYYITEVVSWVHQLHVYVNLPTGRLKD